MPIILAISVYLIEENINKLAFYGKLLFEFSQWVGSSSTYLAKHTQDSR
ncbi:hypothetical protein [Agarivorans sp. Alg241-V36]|nr:hypothetical protein [Agarivorans sp. Alg241-V36]